MGWLNPPPRRKAQTIPALGPLDRGDSFPATGARPVANEAFWEAISPADALYPEPNFVNNAEYGFGLNELAYACVMEKATSLPDAPMRVYGPDGMGDPREEHPLRQLLANPNPVLTEYELWELTSIYLDLAGIAFWEIVTDRANRVTELWPLRPDKVRIFPMRDHYEYGYLIGQSRLVDLGRDVISFTYPNPTSPALGQAPMRAANRAVHLDNEATDFVKALLQNHAVPGVVIETEQKVDDTLTKRLTEKWLERFSGHLRGTPAFLQKGMKVHTLGLNLGELEFPDLRTISESRICAAFGVPPILVGAKVGLDRSTFANYAEARRSFWEETLMPLQKRFTQRIVKELMPRVEGVRPRRSVVRFDNSDVLALKESEKDRWDSALLAVRAGAITINQFCRRVGLPTTSDGDVYLIPAGVTPVGSPAEVIELQAQARAAQQPPDDTEDEAPEDEAGTETSKASRYPDQLVAYMPGDGQAGVWIETSAKPDDPAVEAFARDIALVVNQQRDEVISEGEKVHALLAIQRDEKMIPWDADRWNAELAKAIEPHMRKAAFRAARKVDSGAATEPMLGYVRAASRNVSERWNEQTRLELDAAVVTGGADVLDKVGAVFAAAAGARALTLAVSMSTEMNGFGKVDTAKRVGLPMKTWVVTSANPREEHAEMDGETVPVDEDFSNGMRWPGGPNCQCDVEIGDGT